MKQLVSHRWKIVVFIVVVLVFASSGYAGNTVSNSNEVSLSASFRTPAGATGTVEVCVELEEDSSASALPAPETLTDVPETPSVQKPSTLGLVGLGVLGLLVMCTRWGNRSLFCASSRFLNIEKNTCQGEDE